MTAPNRPVDTRKPRWRSSSAKRSTRGAAWSGGAAPVKPGRVVAGLDWAASVVGFSAPLFSDVPVSDEPFSAPLFSVLPVVGADSLLRLSVLYQPEPLKMIPTGWKSRRVVPPQVGQTEIGSSTTRCRISKRVRQSVHSYS